MELKDEKNDTRSPLTIRGLRPEQDELHEMNLTDKTEEGSEFCFFSHCYFLIGLPSSLIFHTLLLPLSNFLSCFDILSLSISLPSSSFNCLGSNVHTRLQKFFAIVSTCCD